MSLTKLDLRRELHELYSARRRPALIEVPELQFLMVDGHGDPNSTRAFQAAVGALYSVAYTLKFALRRDPDGLDYQVMPLEALWWNTDADTLDLAGKAKWSWTAMILTPAQVSADSVSRALEAATAKRELPAAPLLRLERYGEGLSAQVLHVGPYSAEGPTIEALHAFIAGQGRTPSGRHHEIYLGDPGRSAPEKLRTIVRQPVTR